MKEAQKIHTLYQVHPEESILSLRDFNVLFERNHILKNVNIDFFKGKITCIVGPSGSGKSTLVRSMNRINEEYNSLSCEGEILFKNQSIFGANYSKSELRTKIGMLFQKPCVFPASIAENVIFGLKHQRKLSRANEIDLIEEKLREVALWEEVSERLDDPAQTLSIGQQQRLCLARALAVDPEVILLDEPTSALDPLSTKAIENLLMQLKNKYTIVLVTHNINQAKRLADYVAFVCRGQLMEFGEKSKIFQSPDKQETKEYLQDENCMC